MNIMIVCTSPGLGGLELYAKREWEFFYPNEQHHLYYALSQEGGNFRSMQEKTNNSVIFIKSGKFFPYISAIKLAHKIDQYDIDIVHMHWGNDLHLCSLAKFFSKKKPKLVYTRHMRITRPKKDPLHRFFYRQVDLLLAVSRCVEDEARYFLPLQPSQVALLHLGVPAPTKATSRCEDEIKNYSRETKLKIGMIGRIEHGKGQHILVGAVKILKEKGLDIQSFIIGHEMNKDYINNLKRFVTDNNLESNITFIDFIKEPSRIMPCFDVITLLTYCETFGLVLVEAMRAGVCVIGTDAGGVPDIIDHNQTGLLIEPGNPEALATALERLYNSTELRTKLAKQGQESANQRFNEATHFINLEAIMGNLLTSS